MKLGGSDGGKGLFLSAAMGPLMVARTETAEAHFLMRDELELSTQCIHDILAETNLAAAYLRLA